MILWFMPKTIFHTVRLCLRLQFQNDWLAFCYDSPEDASAAVVRRLFNKTINREKRLSPRSSSAPWIPQISPSSFFRSNQGSPEPLRMPPQDALLASSPPRSGHKPKKRETPRACPLSENPFFDARTGTLLGPPAAGFVYSHGAAYAQEYRLRLKRTTPIHQG